jgi:SAM-dependent MidA family methyltransferase
MGLKALIAAQIAATGPMRLADYMGLCLFHPEHGYYTTRDPFGTAGDFVTAPDISQMFGELLGLWLAQCWLDQGAPAPVTLAELGPGRGVLMADALRATKGVPGFHAALRVHLVEASPRLRAVQADRLAAFAPAFHDHADGLPEAPLLVIANEFFDALPIRQFHRDGAGWRETVVGLDGDRLALGLSPPVVVPGLRGEGIVEVCPVAGPIMARIGGLIARHGGAGLIVDYGAWGTQGDTFQALRGHAFADPLADPGRADLTAHVDFAALAAAAAGCATAFTTQGALLSALGIGARSERLARGLTGEALRQHRDAADRLTNPARMGDLFKAMALCPEGHHPPGFPDAAAHHL